MVDNLLLALLQTFVLVCAAAIIIGGPLVIMAVFSYLGWSDLVGLGIGIVLEIFLVCFITVKHDSRKR